VPWDHSALTARIYFKASNVAQEPAVGARDPARPSTGTQNAARPFTDAQHQQVRSLREKHQLPVPEFKIEGATKDASTSLRRFVGVWLDDTGALRRSRSVMLIVTRVDKDGNAAGHFVYGPPGPTSLNQGPAGTFKWTGRITDDTLTFTSSTVGDTFKVTRMDGGRMGYYYTNAKGQSSWLVLNPLWTLVETESVPKR
jgi:hypothetical protein